MINVPRLRIPFSHRLARRYVGGRIRQAIDAGLEETHSGFLGLDVADLSAGEARLGGGDGVMVAFAVHAFGILGAEDDVEGECEGRGGVLGVEAGEDVGAGAGVDGCEGEEERYGGGDKEVRIHYGGGWSVKALNELVVIFIKGRNADEFVFL